MILGLLIGLGIGFCFGLIVMGLFSAGAYARGRAEQRAASEWQAKQRDRWAR